jgi:hypothetical protein
MTSTTMTDKNKVMIWKEVKGENIRKTKEKRRERL